MDAKNKQGTQKKTASMVSSLITNKFAEPGDQSHALGYAVTYVVTLLLLRAPVAEPRHG